MIFKTILEAARELRTSRSSLYRILNGEDAPRAIKVGGKTLISEDELSRWIATRPTFAKKGPRAA